MLLRLDGGNDDWWTGGRGGEGYMGDSFVLCADIFELPFVRSFVRSFKIRQIHSSGPCS